jgi:hypothetical protein
MREALSEHLKRLHYRELERRDRQGYEKNPDTGELKAWEGVAAWSEEWNVVNFALGCEG